MQPDHLAKANSSHHECIVRRTEEAIRSLRDAGKRISFYKVAEKAQVARSTLYNCDDLRALVQEARDSAPLPNGAAGSLAADITDLERQLLRVTAERDALRRQAQTAPSCLYSLMPLSKAS